MTKGLLAVAALLSFLAAPGSAHVTVGAEPYTEPVVVGQPFNLTVLFSEPCFEMPIELATGNDELTAILDPTAPAYATSTAGQTVPWTIEDCDPTDPTGRLVQAALLTVVVDSFAPGLTQVAIPVNYRNANGESGGKHDVNVTIAYFANGTLSAAAPTGHDATHASGTSTLVELTLDYATNAESVLTVEATTTSGAIAPIAEATLTPPSFDNKSRGLTTVTAVVTPPAEGGSADLTFKAFLAPKAGGDKVQVGLATLRITHAAPETHDGHSDEEHEHAEDKESPAPVFAFVGLGLLAFAALRRR